MRSLLSTFRARFSREGGRRHIDSSFSGFSDRRRVSFSVTGFFYVLFKE
jgi:hypothetical protein